MNPLAPPTIIVNRREPIHPKFAFPQTFERAPVEAMPDQAGIQDAPGPIAYTQWWNVGRDAAHAWPTHMLFQSLAIPDWLGVMGWPFSAVGHTKAGSLVTMPQGRFQPQVQRSVIDMPGQTSVSAQASVRGPITVDINNLKLA